MSEDRQNVDTAAEPDEKGWEALRPAVKYPVAEGALDADSPQEDVQDTQPETQTGAFARIRAEAPGTAAEPDVATGAVPIAPARSKLGERGVGQRVRTYTSVSTGFIPLVREVHNAPKSPTLSALSQDARSPSRLKKLRPLKRRKKSPARRNTAPRRPPAIRWCASLRTPMRLIFLRNILTFPNRVKPKRPRLPLRLS